MGWKIIKPFPMVCVMVECAAPLILYRIPVNSFGSISITGSYKLIVSAVYACPMTQECAEHVWGANRLDMTLTEEERRVKIRSGREDAVKPKGPRELRNRSHEGNTADLASSSTRTRRPVRRDLMPELGATRDIAEERKTAKTSTLEWVERIRDQERRRLKRKKSSEKVSSGSAEWYRASEKEAAVANEIYAQNGKWVRADEAKMRLQEVEQGRCSERTVPLQASAVMAINPMEAVQQIGVNGPVLSKAQEESLWALKPVWMQKTT